MKLVSKISNNFERIINKYITKYRNLDSRKRTRFLVLLISSILISDYIMFCYLADKNIFDIFPYIPCLDNRKEISIYIPNREAKGILKETRKMHIPEDKEVFSVMLYNAVTRGSLFDNTAAVVPIKTFVRRAWVCGDTCVIDIDFEIAKSNIMPLVNSYEIFSTALEKTILENILGVKKFHLLINGIKRYNW